jgi:aminopeptidase-like protein
MATQLTEVLSGVEADASGKDMYRAVCDLFPLCRSITGTGLRHTLAYVRAHVPLEVHEVPSGTPVLDWTVPKEWTIRDAYIADTRGERVVDFRRSNLHVLNYSVPVNARMSLAELRPYLHTLPEAPDWVPYRTSYYRETWGFCLSHRQLLALPDADYDVCIDSSLEAGHLSYGEYFLPGSTADEVLISCHACHPSLANDNLSGIVVAMTLARLLSQCALRYSYRFLFLPGTIGSITWLARNESRLDRVKHGLVLACLGDEGGFTYKKSRRDNTEIDHVVAHVLRAAGLEHRIEQFSPYGYDERQFCSPGFNLPMGCLMRTPHGRFPEYHTSADNLDFVKPAALADSLTTCLAVLETLEANRYYMSTNPRGEPNLGKRGLYRATGGFAHGGDTELALLWLLNLSDGQHSLLDIAARSGRSVDSLRKGAELLQSHGLLSQLPKRKDNG